MRKKDMSYNLMLLILNNTIESYMCVFLHVWSAAPHEICKDEYQGLMTWKRASAGETVYNKCPTNATGECVFVPDTPRTGLSLSFTFIYQTELYWDRAGVREVLVKLLVQVNEGGPEAE